MRNSEEKKVFTKRDFDSILSYHLGVEHSLKIVNRTIPDSVQDKKILFKKIKEFLFENLHVYLPRIDWCKKLQKKNVKKIIEKEGKDFSILPAVFSFRCNVK
jgi:hypothetical protein